MIKERKNSCFMDVEVCDLVAGGVCRKDLSVMQVLGVQLILWVYASIFSNSLMCFFSAITLEVYLTFSDFSWSLVASTSIIRDVNCLNTDL